MEAFLVSTGLVALAEVGDKTQLLSLVLAARLRRPWAISAGILVATLANHALAGLLGRWAATLAGPEVLRWAVGLGFIAMAAWVLVPDRLEDSQPAASASSAFVAALVAFFLAEMGDKTQVATVALAARYPSLLAVVAGTTLGMMIANVPVVVAGHRFADRLPLKAIRVATAVLLLGLGLAALLLPRS